MSSTNINGATNRAHVNGTPLSNVHINGITSGVNSSTTAQQQSTHAPMYPPTHQPTAPNAHSNANSTYADGVVGVNGSTTTPQPSIPPRTQQNSIIFTLHGNENGNCVNDITNGVNGSHVNGVLGVHGLTTTTQPAVDPYMLPEAVPPTTPIALFSGHSPHLPMSPSPSPSPLPPPLKPLSPQLTPFSFDLRRLTNPPTRPLTIEELRSMYYVSASSNSSSLPSSRYCNNTDLQDLFDQYSAEILDTQLFDAYDVIFDWGANIMEGSTQNWDAGFWREWPR